MFCPKCGSENQEGVQFCRNCGTRISSATRDTPIQHTSRKPVTEQERRPEKIGIIGGIVRLVVFIVVIILGIIFIAGILGDNFIVSLIALVITTVIGLVSGQYS
ncbi:MAG: hypothetical protein PWQ74_720 [Methanobacteriaceae archaeon]|nr:hypothetical protein [Methanobacteriaceae archaeon]